MNLKKCLQLCTFAVIGFFSFHSVSACYLDSDTRDLLENFFNDRCVVCNEYVKKDVKPRGVRCTHSNVFHRSCFDSCQHSPEEECIGVILKHMSVQERLEYLKELQESKKES